MALGLTLKLQRHLLAEIPDGLWEMRPVFSVPHYVVHIVSLKIELKRSGILMTTEAACPAA
jgi:hypothetical protein